MNYSAAELIQKLNLEPHPEGGYFAETYRSTEIIPSEALSPRFDASRNISTAIYFLLEGHQFSAFHRIKSDELWHFYYGAPLMVYIIHPDGRLETLKMGSDLDSGCQFQGTVKAGCWFASQPIKEDGFSLVGCTVAPGFDFGDFELAGAKLIEQFPQHTALIKRFLPR